jgi:hypothetical protein
MIRNLWKNLFCTTIEQLSSTQKGSRQKRKHVKAVQTPAQRLLATDQLAAADRQGIETSLAEQNPFAMKALIEFLLGQVWQQRKALISVDEEGVALGAGSTLRCPSVMRQQASPVLEKSGDTHQQIRGEMQLRTSTKRP